MYDCAIIESQLADAGYEEITVHAFNTSGIPGWNEIGPDIDAAGGPYKPGSLYVAARA